MSAWKVKTSVVGLMLAITGAQQGTAQDMQMPPAQVEVATAEERLLAPTIDVPGTIISLNDSQISAEVEGPVVWIAHVGTSVRKGDVIARIDSRLLRLQMRQAQANLERLKADMVFRREEVERFEALAKGDNTSKARLQEVIAARAMLEQDILDAEATLERVSGDLARSEIKAPFPGHVAARLANIGEYLSVGSEVLRLVDTQDVEVALAAPLTIAPFLRQGLEIDVYDTQKFARLPIRTIVPVGDMTSRMMEVRLSVEPGEWVIGSAVKVRLPKGPSVTSVAVPRDALVLKGGKAYLYKVIDGGQTEQVTADLGKIVGLWVAAGESIKVGDKVIIRGGERLMPGQSVVVAQ